MVVVGWGGWWGVMVGGVGVQCRWEKGLGLGLGLGLGIGLGLGLGELEEKWRENEKSEENNNKRTKCFYSIQNR